MALCSVAVVIAHWLGPSTPLIVVATKALSQRKRLLIFLRFMLGAGEQHLPEDNPADPH